MTKISTRLKVSGSTIALAAALSCTGAMAQAQPAQEAVEQVTVSASRITIAGYEQPTPVTVVGIQDLERDAHTQIGDSIRQLPAITGGSSAANGQGSGTLVGAVAGADTINLRNMGVTRVLVLFDGQRVVASNLGGPVDMATIPTSLVQRIDVVTGGASAAWGSDAVTGVVNLVLNKTFTGFKANIEGSDTYNDSYRRFKVDATWGARFLGDRAHVILSGTYVNAPNAVFAADLKWFKGSLLVNNPAWTATNGQPRRIMVPNTGMAGATTGGVITASPAAGATPANALRGIQFVGAGQMAPFNFGNMDRLISWGGDANIYTGEMNTWVNSLPYRNTQLFGFASYRLTDDTVASLQVNYGTGWSPGNAQNASFIANQNITRDNAYIPTALRDQMTALNIPSFTMGTTNSNNMDLRNMSIKDSRRSVGMPMGDIYRSLKRAVFSLDGSLGDDWSWNAYLQHSQSRIDAHVKNNQQRARMALAVDAVYVTPANRGNSGLPIGSIACRARLAAVVTGIAVGCQPLNIFGEGVASDEAIDYVTRNSEGSNGNYMHLILNQSVGALTVQGVLPWGLPAGRAAVAFGAEHRREGGKRVTDVDSNNNLWANGNFKNFTGYYHVEEGFLQVDVPLLRDNFVQSLDLSAAGRISNYSTAGLAKTWKLGLTSQIIDDVRLRTTWSTDIRAPNVNDLFQSPSASGNTSTDPKTGKGVQIFTSTQGNPNLLPETANTISAGVVLTPSFIDRLSISLDYYSISIKGAIGSVAALESVRQCSLGVAIYCDNLVWGGPNGELTIAKSQPANLFEQGTSGFDFQADYSFPLWGGDMSWRLMSNYTDSQTQTDNIGFLNYAGSIGFDSRIRGVPKLKGTLSTTYSWSDYSLTVQGRFIGDSRVNKEWRTGVDIDNNIVPAIGYLDLRGSWTWSENIQFYGAIDNVTGVPGVEVPGSQDGSNVHVTTNTRSDIYDTLGRSFRVGVRFSY